MRAIILYSKASLLFVSICTMANVAKEIVLGRIHDVCFGEQDVGVAISLSVEAPSTAGVRTTSKWTRCCRAASWGHEDVAFVDRT